MRVSEILQSKGNKVHRISRSASLADAVASLVLFNCGSLMVEESQSIFGIITERDILKAIDSQKQSLSELLVRDFMSRKLITGNLNDEIASVMGVMTSNRVRHLPIFEEGRLVGMISIGDIVKAQYELLAVENHYLKTYIQG